MIEAPYKVSIGIPVYNASKYIERCARSIFSQDYDDLEIIFVDDASSDNSVKIIRETLKDYPNREGQVHIIQHERNKGVSEARNTLLAAFTGLFISFVDSDDYLLPCAIKRLVQEQTTKDYDLVSGQILEDFGEEEHLITDSSPKSADGMLFLVTKDTITHYNVARIYRLSIINQHSIHYEEDIKYGEDWIFLVEFLLKATSVSWVNDTIYVYDRTNEQSAMHNILKKENFCKFVLADMIVFSRMKQLVDAKEQKYSDVIECQMAKRLEDGLIEAYYTNNNKMFAELKQYIGKLRKCNISKNYHYRKASLGSYVSPLTYKLYFLIRKLFSNPLKRLMR